MRLCYKGSIILKEKDNMSTPYEEMSNQTEAIGQAYKGEMRFSGELERLRQTDAQAISQCRA